ncbi:unnamed protein product, partial [Mesorhabditis spiculigera]
MNLSGYFGSLTLEKWWLDFKVAFVPPSQPTFTLIDPSVDLPASPQSSISIIVFLSGISIARFSLWMVDLAITQVMQEGIPESQRNTVFGIQNAVSQIFSVLKDVMVVLLPDPATFGICIFISYAFVSTGYLSYLYYLLKSKNEKAIKTENLEDVAEALMLQPVVES